MRNHPRGGQAATAEALAATGRRSMSASRNRPG
jgi:hypothetical protein